MESLYIEEQELYFANEEFRKRSKSNHMIGYSLRNSFRFYPNPEHKRGTDLSLEQPFLDSSQGQGSRSSMKTRISRKNMKITRRMIREHSNPNEETYDSDADRRSPSPNVIPKNKRTGREIERNVSSESEHDEIRDEEPRFENFSNTYSNVPSRSFTNRLSKRDLQRSFKTNFQPNGIHF